jgi:hypothetical protein
VARFRRYGIKRVGFFQRVTLATLQKQQRFFSENLAPEREIQVDDRRMLGIVLLRNVSERQSSSMMCTMIFNGELDIA